MVTDEILRTVRRVWGFSALRPLQAEAIQAGIEQRDSLVVLPTGGGKSLCYQAPPLIAGRTDIVVSPLISLMKDQVDSLEACGYAATTLHSGMTPAERRRACARLRAGECRLVFVAPERLLSPWFLDLVGDLSIHAFAIDEAHCISHWGHDFRPEYRQLAVLKDRFPGASVHAYTATATDRVRADIIEQLGLDDPAVLVGCFDRPNLVYRILPRLDLHSQVDEVIARHTGQAVIIYCITRAETERLAAHLSGRGLRAAHYHAGMGPDERRRTQDDFANERIDVIVATVAFGMGIDRSDVRCVIHAAMPKSIEHYQQETGRAGRDDLEAECVLFYSPADVLRWKSLIERSVAEAEAPAAVAGAALALIEQMRRFAAPGRCRHRSLSEHFGQTYERDDCRACDVCLEECEALEEGTVEAQKILSCVARTEERFGTGHIVDVLRGAETERVRSLCHDQLSTYGLMREMPRAALTSMVFQLIDQGLLERTGGDYPVLELNDASWSVMRGERQVWLMPTRRSRKIRKSAVELESWEGVDHQLFERLRLLRTEIARERGVPPYVIFSDASLRDIARLRPQTDPEFLAVHGVGEKKLANFGPRFMAAIADFAADGGVMAGVLADVPGDTQSDRER